ncbi:hypothetical protein QOM21_27915 [Streptomyces sp. Pv4-95]|uniref:hypothetical protein n=1 Tax=Streptomyces sp. Pv4-95 TaxID=3049543 RepID=UPI0038923484
MRSTRLLTGAGVSLAALGLSATAAYAGDFGVIEVSPHPARPGSTISLAVTGCGNSRTASVDTSTLGTGTIKLTQESVRGPLTGELTIRQGTWPGNYGISGTCAGGKDLTGTVHIGRGSGSTAAPAAGTHAAPAGGHTAAPAGGPSTAPADGPASPPKGKVATGVGTTSENTDTTEIAAGAAVLLAAVAGGAWASRRRRSGDRI